MEQTKTKTKKLLQFFTTRENTEFVLVKRKDDYVLLIPQEKLKVGNLSSLEKRGFQMIGNPTADVVSFIKIIDKE